MQSGMSGLKESYSRMSPSVIDQDLYLPCPVPWARHPHVFSRWLTQESTKTENTDPELAERHKQDSLAKQKAGKGHWKPELASDSEESVKADR